MNIYQETKRLLEELVLAAGLNEDKLLVIGVSTSEVIGQKIGTSGTGEVAEQIYNAVREAQHRYSFHIAFQCCEHLNRALVVQRSTARKYALEEVAVIPAPQAGGAMASYVFRSWSDPVVVEHIKADAGIDIGETLIGMHIKHVAVPVRGSTRQIGKARVTMAKTRPKLIGGVRAIYILEEKD